MREEEGEGEWRGGTFNTRVPEWTHSPAHQHIKIHALTCAETLAHVCRHTLQRAQHQMPLSGSMPHNLERKLVKHLAQFWPLSFNSTPRGVKQKHSSFVETLGRTGMYIYSFREADARACRRVATDADSRLQEPSRSRGLRTQNPGVKSAVARSPSSSHGRRPLLPHSGNGAVLVRSCPTALLRLDGVVSAFFDLLICIASHSPAAP